MEDNDIAKLLISTIISEEIVELDFLPQERTISLERRSLTVYRLDFAATIKQPDQTYKQVIIEIQKAKFAADIMRFRRYLGDQYHNKENIYTKTIDHNTTTHAMADRPIETLGGKTPLRVACRIVIIEKNFLLFMQSYITKSFWEIMG